MIFSSYLSLLLLCVENVFFNIILRLDRMKIEWRFIAEWAVWRIVALCGFARPPYFTREPMESGHKVAVSQPTLSSVEEG